jgi:hypothetical protein
MQGKRTVRPLARTIERLMQCSFCGYTEQRKFLMGYRMDLAYECPQCRRYTLRAALLESSSTRCA